MNRFLTIIITTFVFIFNTSIMAQTRAERRVKHQQNRIENGNKSENINEQEAAKIQNGQARVDQAMTNASTDGDVTLKEKRHVNNMQDRQSRKIHRAKKN